MRGITKSNGEVRELIAELQCEGKAKIVSGTPNESIYLVHVPNIKGAPSYSFGLIERYANEGLEYRIIKDSEISQHVENYITSFPKRAIREANK